MIFTPLTLTTPFNVNREYIVWAKETKYIMGFCTYELLFMKFCPIVFCSRAVKEGNWESFSSISQRFMFITCYGQQDQTICSRNFKLLLDNMPFSFGFQKLRSFNPSLLTWFLTPLSLTIPHSDVNREDNSFNIIWAIEKIYIIGFCTYELLSTGIYPIGFCPGTVKDGNWKSVSSISQR